MYILEKYEYTGLRFLLLLGITSGLVAAANVKTAELVYDTEAASMPDSVERYTSISGCYFKCNNRKCVPQEQTTDNFCLMIAAVLTTKDGNFREGHFDPEVSLTLSHP